jgi:hypothetical protein
LSELRDSLSSWENDGFDNKATLDLVYSILALLVAKVEDLESQIEALSN